MTLLTCSTCAWVQEVYGIDNATLWANNPQIDDTCSNIYIGEVLCVDTNGFNYPEFNQTKYEVSSCTERTNDQLTYRPSLTPTCRSATKRARSRSTKSIYPLHLTLSSRPDLRRLLPFDL